MQKPQKEYLSLYSRDCLSCHHLVDGAAVKARRCHFERGNKSCPASEVKIVITGRLRAQATALAKARAEQDLDAEVRILQAIGKESDDARKTFYQLLDKLTVKSAGN